MLFLSYAEADSEVARQITAVLDARRIEYYDWQGKRGGRFIEAIEEAISQANAFFVLMSPHFLASSWCRMERELAIQREHDLRAVNPGFVFIHVLQVADTKYGDSGFLRRYDWHDLTDRGSRRQMLDALVGRLTPGTGTRSESPGRASDRNASLFRNRRQELERVMHGLTNVGGPHFWVVVAPPQLGKTWFLDRLSAEINRSGPETAEEGKGPAQWVTRLVDLREQPAELRTDTTALIAQLFGPLIGGEDATPRAIAQGISRTGRPHLCLLDSAELLAKETADALRAELSNIYHLVPETGNADVRVGVVVATRREQDWRGVAPNPRLSVLSLTEFSFDIVLQALREFADEMKRSFFGPGYFELNAKRVHSLSEGLPALLVPCLQWIREEEWLGLERLETEDLFAEIAYPYIKDRLLERDSLYPEADDRPNRWRQGQPAEQLEAVEQAFRLLVPYRLFTQSHLRHHVESDPDFADALRRLAWSVEDMWGAISGSALLRRPLDEPWQEIYPAIRRLLFRYCYQSDDTRALAHSEARKFVEVWADSQMGKEQVIGLLESLWHEACALWLSHAGDMEERLSDSAKKLSLALRASQAYTVAELRAFAANRMLEDEEFQQAVNSIDGLFNRLASIIREPPREQ